MSTHLAADLLEEIRRLRIRITGLNPQQLDEAVSVGQATDAPVPMTADPTASASSPAPTLPRRERIRLALLDLSQLRADGQPVPDLGDRVLSDQVVVLLSDCLPEFGATREQTAQALNIAQRLRGDLA